VFVLVCIMPDGGRVLKDRMDNFGVKMKVKVIGFMVKISGCRRSFMSSL